MPGMVANGQGNNGGAAPSVGGGSIGGDPLGGAVNTAGDWASQFSDWLADKTARPNYTGYDINRSAFTDPYLQSNLAKFGAAGEAAAGREADPQFLQGQRDLVAQLAARANGTGGPSLAELMLNRTTNKNAAMQAGAMSSGAARAINPALAARMAGTRGAEAQQEAAGQASVLRAQEQQAAQSLLGSVLASGRQQSQQQQAQNDELVKFYTSLGFSEEAAQNQANQALEALSANQATALAGINAQANQGYNQSLQQWLGGGIGAIAGGVGGAIGSGAGGVGGAAGGIAAALHDGGTVPGVDTGRDDKLVAARGGEVFVPPDNPGYDMARAMVEKKPAAVTPAKKTDASRAKAKRLAQKLVAHLREAHASMPGGTRAMAMQAP